MTAPNENRPGYKKTQAGWIPEEWTISDLGNVAKINCASLDEQTDPDYRFYYIDLSSVKEGAIELPQENTRFSEAPCRARRVVKNGDVLLATVRPNLRGFGYIDFDAVDLICSTGFQSWRPKIIATAAFCIILFIHPRHQDTFMVALLEADIPP